MDEPRIGERIIWIDSNYREHGARWGYGTVASWGESPSMVDHVMITDDRTREDRLLKRSQILTWREVHELRRP